MKPTQKLPEARKPRTPLVIPDPVALRALSRWTFQAPTGCHLSTYAPGSHGYPQLGWREDKGSRGTLAHRAAWTAVHGPIPEGMTIDHTCKNPMCVNVAHLRLLTNWENARRTSGRDWTPDGKCIAGHDPEHLYQIPSGRIRCRPCNQAAQRRYQEKQKAKRRGRAAA